MSMQIGSGGIEASLGGHRPFTDIPIDLTQGLWGVLTSWYDACEPIRSLFEMYIIEQILFIGFMLVMAYYAFAMIMYVTGKLSFDKKSRYQKHSEDYLDAPCTLIASRKKRKYWAATYQAAIDGQTRTFKTAYEQEPKPEQIMHYRPDRKTAWVEGDQSWRTQQSRIFFLIFGTPFIIMCIPFVFVLGYIALALTGVIF